MATVATVAALRVKRVLQDLGVGPAELERELGRSRSTWSRFLSGQREPSGDPRGELGRLLEARGLPVTEDLWRPEPAPGSNTDPPQTEVVMQGQILSETARTAFRLFRSPFDPEAIRGEQGPRELFLPPAHKFVLERVRQALLTAGFVAVSGEPGSGKTTLLDAAMRRAAFGSTKVVSVRPANVERRKLSAAHISSEIIRQLSEEPVPRITNVRDAKAAEVLAHRYEQGERVALIIDEAHELPANTIKDLKRFHELKHGYAQLLAVILVGQTELRARFDLERNHQLREAIIRCQLVTLGPMAGKSPEYIARRFEWVSADVQEVFEPEALEAVEARLAVHGQQYPVIIGNVATAAMNVAARRGMERVTEDEVEAVWASTADQLQDLGL